VRVIGSHDTLFPVRCQSGSVANLEHGRLVFKDLPNDRQRGLSRP